MSWLAIKAASKPGMGGAGRRKTWSLLQREPDGSYSRVHLPELDALNKAYAAGIYDWSAAYDSVRGIRDRLYKQRDLEAGKRVFCAENRKLFEAYWAREYATRDIVDPDTMRWDFLRAVDAVGELHLLGATRDQLQQQVDRYFVGRPSQQRRAVDRLNSLLRYHGRGEVRLRKMREAWAELAYLTPAEFELVAAQIRDVGFRNMCGVAFYTGMRLGEVAATSADCLMQHSVAVVAQVDKFGVRRQTKNRKKRKAYVIPAGRVWLDAWLALPEMERTRVRLEVKHAAKFRSACRRALGGDATPAGKQCVFHDLRHSYAIYLAQRGASLTLIAQSIGDSIRVAEKYYSGYVLQEEGIETLERLVAGE